MHREYRRWYTDRLGREMGIAIYGHWGLPLLTFPTSGGDEWEQLAAASELADFEPEQYVRVGERVTLQFAMPMPSVSLIELDPAG